MKISKILIVGSSGNIGKHLVAYLSLSKKNKVYCFDNKPTNKKKFIKGNVFSYYDLKKIPKEIDQIIYLVGLIGGAQSLDINYLEKYIKLNCDSLIFFLENFKGKNIKKIIFASTEHVYGDKESNQRDNQKIETFPKNYYGISKLMAEKYLFNYQKKKKISVDILRFPRVVTKKSKNLINKIINTCLKNKKLYLYKSKIKFNFIYIDDLINSVDLCLKKSKTGFRIFDVFNDNKSVSLNTLTKMIVGRLEKKIKIKFHKNKFASEHNPFDIKISNNYTKRELGWIPLFSLKKIVKHLVDFHEA